MPHNVGKLEAASHQLDWAIRLLIDHDAPLPAITLAGAAEEILGKALGDRSAHEELIRTFAMEYSLERKILSQQHLNKARNWLKHWSPDTEPAYEQFELGEEALQGIIRALSNMLSYNQSLPAEGPRFIDWIRAKPDYGP
jgi:predicted ATP-dependent endonuclease of OLD family